MYKLNDKLYANYKELYSENSDLISFAVIMKHLCCNKKTLDNIIKQNNLNSIPVICLPSGKINKLYKKSDFRIIKNIYNDSYRNEIPPKYYYSEEEFLSLLKINSSQFKNIKFWCSSFTKYSKIYYIKNKKHRLYLYNEKTKLFYDEKLNKYFNGNKKELNENMPIDKNNVINDISYFNSFRLQKTKEYKHHKIELFNNIMSELFDTTSRYYHILIDIYKTYSNQTIEDVTLFELHHIIPRFYVRNGNYFDKLNNLENLIYLPPNIHFLVHFLEYKCSVSYKNEFLSSICIKSATLNYEQMDNSYVDEIIKLLIKAFYK